MAKDDDVQKLKNALIDEMGSSLSNLNDFVNSAIEDTTEDKMEGLLSSVLGMSHQIGYLTAVYNQFIVFERGMVEDNPRIGFASMLHKDDKK